MSSFPKAARPQWAGREAGGKRPSSAGPSSIKPTIRSKEVYASNGEEETKKNAAHDPKAATKVESSVAVPKAAPKEPKRPLSARRVSLNVESQVNEEGYEPRASESPRPHHEDHSLVEDHLPHPIDHSIHWSQIGRKPKKNDLMAQAIAQIANKKNDVILERLLKEDSDQKLQNAKLMSSVAGTIVNAVKNPEGERKAALRTAKSMKRDQALEQLTKVMAEAEEQKEKEEQEAEEDEGWEMLAFEESPARNRERREAYSVLTQQRKMPQPGVPRPERKGKHPLDLIAVLEVVPNTPPPKACRPVSLERETHRERITVHAADFIKYGNDVKTLRTCKLDLPHVTEPEADDPLPKAPSSSGTAPEGSTVQEPVRVKEEPTHFIPSNPWGGQLVCERFSQNDSGINEVWFPPTPQKGGGSQSSTRASSTESRSQNVYDRLYKQPTSRRGSGSGMEHLQVPHDRGWSKEPSGSRARSKTPSQSSSRPSSRPPSARGSRPNSARPYADPARPALPLLPQKLHVEK